MAIRRRTTRQVRAGGVAIGGDAPVAVQSMTNTPTRDAAATLDQIRRLAAAGCDLVRVAVPDADAAAALPRIVREAGIPVVADIHFDHRLALAALEAGVHKLRINPGNIGSQVRIRTVVQEAARRGVPIRIGVNAGSLEKDILRRHGHPTAEAMVESALRHVSILEELDFHDIVISLKASDIPMTVAAYRGMAVAVDYPLHLGITEAGTFLSGTVASAIGIGALLVEGIGDTLRVSLTAPPEEEVRVGFEILKVLELRLRGPRFISCPSCGRTAVNLIEIAESVERALADLTVPLRIAVMGCEVNGPGEAAEADIGLACGQKASLIFCKGAILRRIPNSNLVAEFCAEVRRLAGETHYKDTKDTKGAKQPDGKME
jgi:(E)-4-hydroxy-3-methylbut-2-enyl-diphosphate synthase